LAAATAFLLCSTVLAEESEHRLEVGIGFRYMPTGWFDWSHHPGLGAYPALGFAPFVDYRLNRFLSLGFMPELTLNVIPDLPTGYSVSRLIATSIRLKAQYPEWRSAIPYVMLAPGYSWLSRYGADPGGNAHGFLLGAYGGLRVPVSARNSLFAEGGYLQGFQSDSHGAYAPSYLVFAFGWQASLY
jgi:hypothetical protein